jgi:hypothetical protein
VYERYLAARSINRTAADAFELAPALERLGRLYESRGDSVRSAIHYRRFAELWRGADPPIRARRGRVAALRRNATRRQGPRFAIEIGARVDRRVGALPCTIRVLRVNQLEVDVRIGVSVKTT